jgi:aminoglycoside 6'-N-acetyltransferase
MNAYTFRTLQRADLPMLAQWLRTPEPMQWWGEPEAEYALLEEDLDEPAMRQWIVTHHGHPFAYTQAYDPARWPQSHLLHLPAGAQVIDAFIGEPAMLGIGHGSRFLRALAEKLIAEGATAVAIDPAADNLRARRAYARAGFRGDTIVPSESGPAVVMLFQPAAY